MVLVCSPGLFPLSVVSLGELIIPTTRHGLGVPRKLFPRFPLLVLETNCKKQLEKQMN